MKDIEKLEGSLWEAADQLRANSKLTASEYSMPVLGLIFLRHAFNRFLIVKEKIEPSLPSRKGKKRQINKDDFYEQSAIFLPEKARFDYLISLPQSDNIGKAINDAMKSIEDEYEKLKGVLPKNYNIFENDLLIDLLKIFNRQELQNAEGDVFGRIYEYFLNKFAMTGAQEGGEFFTPVSLVQMIVNVIEPERGIVLDPACGSAGMFVQTGYFIERLGQNPNQNVTFYGQEKAAVNTRLAQMNLAVHGMEGEIAETNTFYNDVHDLIGKCDFVMANPPFNVDGVDAEKIKSDPRLIWGLPGINSKTKAVSNANYLWIQYFYSYLNDGGRAGFVMASSATDAGYSEKIIREQLVRTGHVDMIISIGTNFFYTKSLPCTLWFFDRGKRDEMKDKVLMIDARSIFRKVTRKINDFSPEQLRNITSIVWLYRGENEKYFKLVQQYLEQCILEMKAINVVAVTFEVTADLLISKHKEYLNKKQHDDLFDIEKIQKYKDIMEELEIDYEDFKKDVQDLLKDIAEFNSGRITELSLNVEEVNKDQLDFYKMLEPICTKMKSSQKQVEHICKLNDHILDYIYKEMEARQDSDWDNRLGNEYIKQLNEDKQELLEPMKQTIYFHQQVHWLQSRFPEAKLEKVEGLCKMVSRDDIEQADWSLMPGRYVGVVPKSEEGFDFEERMREIHEELQSLNEEAFELAKIIQGNFGELGI